MNETNIFGLPVTALPWSFNPLEAVVVIKALNDDGEVVYLSRATEGLSSVEALGMLTLTSDKLRGALSDD